MGKYRRRKLGNQFRYLWNLFDYRLILFWFANIRQPMNTNKIRKTTIKWETKDIKKNHTEEKHTLLLFSNRLTGKQDYYGIWQRCRNFFVFHLLYQNFRTSTDTLQIFYCYFSLSTKPNKNICARKMWLFFKSSYKKRISHI